MNELEKSRFRPAPCPQCGGVVRVLWTKDDRMVGGIDWVPRSPHCSNGDCPMSNPQEWGIADFSL